MISATRSRAPNPPPFNTGPATGAPPRPSEDNTAPQSFALTMQRPKSVDAKAALQRHLLQLQSMAQNLINNRPKFAPIEMPLRPALNKVVATPRQAIAEPRKTQT